MATKKSTEVAPKEITTSIHFKTISFPIVGVSSLIMSKFSEKAKQQIQEIGEAEKGLKQGGKKKAIADPEQQYANSIYYLSDGKRYGFPALAFKMAMVDAAYRIYGRKMTDTKAAFRVLPDDYDTGLVEIHGTPRMREDMVRVGTINKVASPRYRAEFPNWSAVITIKFIEDVITEEMLLGLLNTAGFSCGVGEWRPQRDGDHGMWEIANE